MRLAVVLAVVAWAVAPLPAAGRPLEPDEAVYRRMGPFYEGYASVPWQAAWSPDGRWVAFVEGHPGRFVAVHDARTREVAWRTTPGANPAALRPAFTRDGERLVLVEGTDLVVRRRGETGWEVEERTPLGFTPSATAYVRPLVLAPDERSVALCDDGRAYRMDLGGTARACRDLGLADAVAVHHLAEGVAVARWSESVAETVVSPSGGVAQRTLPLALLAVAPDGATWLAARAARPADGAAPALSLLDARSRATLGDVALWGDAERGWAFLGAAAFTADGTHLVTMESLRVGFVREARTGRVLQRISEYEGDRMIGFALSPDGSRLLTGGRRAGEHVQDEAVLLWERVGAGRPAPR